MGLSPDVVRAHINHWEDRLGVGGRKHRQRWPSRLFRHEPLENAVKILRDGTLLSRNDAAGQIPRDIAPADIIQHRATGHRSVRMYFRPRSPTQYHMEGIKKRHEIFHDRHAPVLIIMVFQAEEILTLPNVQFSDGNMQSYGTDVLSTDQEFQTIPFDLVYHEGYFDPNSAEGADILRRRCAEVLLPSPFQLQGHLKGVLCRSPAERATLLHYLGDAANHWNGRIRVYREPGLFESQWTYVNTVDGGPQGIAFTLNPRRRGGTVETEMWAWDEIGEQIMHFGPMDLDPSKRWVSLAELQFGTYLVRFELEGCLAYEASFIIDDLPF